MYAHSVAVSVFICVYSSYGPSSVVPITVRSMCPHASPFGRLLVYMLPSK